MKNLNNYIKEGFFDNIHDQQTKDEIAWEIKVAKERKKWEKAHPKSVKEIIEEDDKYIRSIGLGKILDFRDNYKQFGLSKKSDVYLYMLLYFYYSVVEKGWDSDISRRIHFTYETVKKEIGDYKKGFRAIIGEEPQFLDYTYLHRNLYGSTWGNVTLFGNLKRSIASSIDTKATKLSDMPEFEKYKNYVYMSPITYAGKDKSEEIQKILDWLGVEYHIINKVTKEECDKLPDDRLLKRKCIFVIKKMGEK